MTIARRFVVDCAFVAMVALLAAGQSQGASPLAALTQKDAVGGLKAALTQSAVDAIGKLGATDGFLGNPDVKIPLPGKLQCALDAQVAGSWRQG